MCVKTYKILVMKIKNNISEKTMYVNSFKLHQNITHRR